MRDKYTNLVSDLDRDKMSLIVSLGSLGVEKIGFKQVFVLPDADFCWALGSLVIENLQFVCLSFVMHFEFKHALLPSMVPVFRATDPPPHPVFLSFGLR